MTAATCNANNNCDRPPCSLPHTPPRISESMFIITSVDDHDEENRNRIYLYAAVNLRRNLRSTYCTIEATDRHEASRGLSATAGLLVDFPVMFTLACTAIHKLMLIGHFICQTSNSRIIT